MLTATVSVALAVLLITKCLPAGAADLYVSPAGDDANPGTLERPLATLECARNAVRARDHAGKPFVVQLRGGRYAIPRPLVFTPEDSGTQDAPVVYEAFPGETPVISGGIQVTGWSRHDERLWAADVPWARDVPEPFTQLFVNGRRCPRARTPNAGSYFYTKRLMQTDTHGSPCHGMVFREGDLGPWAAGGDAVICLMHNWVNSYNRIGQVDWSRRAIRFTRTAGAYFLGPSVRYYVENAREALDSPGEWYLDRERGKLLYYPAEGEDMARAEVIAPVISQTLVRLTADPMLGQYVEHLVFRGISFQHTDADLSPDHEHSVQGALFQRGAVFAVGARNCVFEDCEFTRLGEHAISLREACQENTITRCHMHDLGGGGVYLSEGGPTGVEDWYLTAHNTVDNNLIHDGGILFRAGCGVFMGGSASYNQITHNEICDLSWVGVHAGWSWTGLVPTYTHHNDIGYNHIHHIGNGVMNDIGGIYTLGVSPGTVLHHNLIHDITRFERGAQGYGGWGIYLDAGSSEITVENNVVYNTRDGGLHLHCYTHPYGDTVRNNVFAYSDEGQMMRNADHEPKQGIHAAVEGNIVYNANPRMLWGSNWSPGSKFTLDRNCYWSEAGAPEFMGKAFDDWQATGRDVNSIVADPGFMDAQARDFRLKEDSPALALGFEPIDLSTVGVYGPREWTQLAASIVHRAFEAAAPVAPEDERVVAQDFEEYEPGETPVGAVAADGATSATVVDLRPAAGVRCLRFVDGEVEEAWKPHWCIWRTPQRGAVRLQCSVRNDPEQPVQFDLEFRDWPRNAGVKYTTGPHISFQPDGTARAADGAVWKPVGQYPVGEWVQVEVVLQEGEGNPGVYALRLGNAQAVEGLRFRDAAFTDCNWIGFAGFASGPGVFYVDEFRVE